MSTTSRGSGNNYLKGTPTFDFAHIVPEPATPAALSPYHRTISSYSYGYVGCVDTSTSISIASANNYQLCSSESRSRQTGRCIIPSYHQRVLIDRYEHVLLNVKGTRAPCLVVDARTTYGRIAYIAMYMTTDVTFNGASTLDDGTGY
jgi:hypothetical protein